MLEDVNIRLFLWINAGAGKNLSLDYIAIFFAEGGPYILSALFVFLWFFTSERRKNELLIAAEASVLGLLLNLGITLVYFHPRPFMRGIGTTLIPHAPETSFPSDHATLLFSASLYLLIFSRWVSAGVVFLIVAILTSLGRVYCGIHFPFDMAGSLFLSTLSCIMVYKGRSLVEYINRWIISSYKKLTA
ncbi:MAG TPA: undecaprenyl-diphosphatase [Nitrospirae bacterium]|nr:undecaprenyl-diphosphatase BcrC [bacterium BMS3Abin10]GBE38782.1 undecaprenyl-diphosphatase BcrC [bacterium BMS3Bbin08]HDH49964.1 undecaprenyl-diphosphatase [Nitrospirota bacterium]HDK17259.1 undecaprenyl-diphosphatase [Nitrospirota bacterium]HDK82459.1 undecaprenyl-diphosphatase [Nitrospirota bacterium]